jgi:hypothetical protein
LRGIVTDRDVGLDQFAQGRDVGVHG